MWVSFAKTGTDLNDRWTMWRVWFARGFFVILLGLLLSACAIRLVPEYSPSIAEELENLNQEIMVLFASVDGGASASTFDNREDTYASIIGRLDALRVTAIARPNPTLGIVSRVRLLPEQADDIPKLEAPTPDILATMIETMSQMRTEDRRRGLSQFVVPGFKRSIDISMDQALTYEKALQR